MITQATPRIQTTIKGFFSSRRSPFRFCSAVTILLGLLVSTAAPVQSRTWYIKADGTGDAPTIQAGVDSAAVGDTVLVAPGTYSDTTHVSIAGTLRAVNVHIQKSVTLLGEPFGPRPLIDKVNSHVGVYVEDVDSTVTIGYLSLRGTVFSVVMNTEPPATTASTERDHPALIRCHSSLLEVNGVMMSNNNDGVLLSNSTADIHDSEFHTMSAAAIACFKGSDATIYDNVIYNGAIGVDCDESSMQVWSNTFGAPFPDELGVGISCGSSTVDVTGNAIRWCGIGVSAIVSAVTIDRNEFSRHHNSGVHLINCSAVLAHNVFYHGDKAIWTQSGTTGEISNNTIDDWAIGILCELGSEHVIRRNIISRGFWGIQCVSALLTVECNDIFGMSSGMYAWLCAGQPGNGNFSADPEYCGVDDSGNYFLQSDSPCTEGNHPSGYECGLIGALSVNCGTVEVRRTTWGSVKSKFRDGGER